MRYRLGQINFVLSIEDNVVIDEGVWRMMNDVISNTPAWRGVSVHSPSAGKFVVTGYVATADEATQLSEDLTVNFPYMDRLDNQVIIQEVLDAQVEAMINGSRLGAVTFQLAGGQLVLMGRYSDTMGTEFEALVKHLNAVKGITSVKNFAVATSPSDAGIDLSDHFQVSGTSTYDGRGYSVVLNEKIYTLGDQVDGMKITAIESSKILLEKDGLRYKIDYRR
jgi:type III secretion system YscD/HrpQ family protein